VNRAGLIVGLIVLVVLAVFGYFWLRAPEPRGPVVATVAPESEAPADKVAPAPAPTQESAPAQSQPSAEQKSGAQEPKEQEPATQEVPAQTARVEPTLTPTPGPAPAPMMRKTIVKPREEQTTAPPQGAPSWVLPSFDVVRVEPSGEAVLAGRAEPSSRLVLLDGGHSIAEAATGVNGQWVIVLKTPLAPGDHELGLESHLTTGQVLLSENVVVVSVPAPAQVATASPEPAPKAAPTAPAASMPEAQPSAPAPAGTTAEPVSPVPSAPAQVAAAPVPGASRPLAVLMPRAGAGPSRILQQPEPVSTGLGEGALVLETVDYDEHGLAVIGGRAVAGVTLIVYLDDRPAGRAVAGSDGRWQTRLDAEVPFGVHLLRVDQIDASGKVVARVESPFSRAVMAAGTEGETAVIVQPGNSLWRIARRIYGKGLRYSVIYQANQDQIRDPDLIYPGQIFVVPQSN
jgi:nucleoid-associated protein YgaU